MTEKGSEGRGHNVNPATDRCVRCGRNRFNRENQPICMTTGDYVEKWNGEESARKEAQQTPHAAGGELREADIDRLWRELIDCDYIIEVSGSAAQFKEILRRALAAQTSPAAGGPRVLGEDAWIDEFMLCTTRVQRRTVLRAYAANLKTHWMIKAAEHPQPAPGRDDYNEPLIRFVARDDVISAIHNVAKVSRAKDCGPHPDDNKKVAGPALEGERET